MNKRKGVKKKSTIVALTFSLFFIMYLIEGATGLSYAFSKSESNEALEAKIIAEELAKQKRVEKKSLISDLLNEGKRNYEVKNYETAIGFFERVTQIDPTNRTARHYINLCKDALGKELPETVTATLIKRGKDNFNRKQYSAAISDFESALASNPNDGEAQAWLAKAKEYERLYGVKKTAKEQYKTLRVTRKVASSEKDTAEQAMMLDVDRAWLPPVRVPREEIEIEEIISPEELAEKEAKKKLEEKMASIIVPAISITDADVQDLIHQLMEMTGVTIVIDERALAELTRDKPIRISLSTANPLPLLDVLNIAFKATQLGYKVEPNYVWISDKAAVEKEELITRTYRLKYGVRKTRKVELTEFETKE
ncbi:MAG: hypothetical protein AMJ78_05845 [Omnitrophica WOR_2 bacterium SM23_29]|nr:MAG: hypothetical protein AMJ78_05845 [Omnitrophica WOR_2 bacterium SM23_29]